MSIAKLALEDGSVFTGRAFGARSEATGEVVFNTSMTGYQEILTDPSYHGQIVTMTYPQIGNYGINPEDLESARPWVRGFVIRQLSSVVSNHRASGSLADYLEHYNIPGIEGIDTRALVRITRIQGAMRGIISSDDLDDARLVARARSAPPMLGADLASAVMPAKPHSWTAGFESPFAESPPWCGHESTSPTQPPPHVVALDFGMKWNILRHLVAIGSRVTVVPGNTPTPEILDLDPDALFVSNGPGDPAALGPAIANLRQLINLGAERAGVPIFGICLGHQLLGLALGAKTFKLKFGHRGANHPVRNLATGKVEITTQNHGFAVDSASLPTHVTPTHINLNDNTLEGLRHTSLPVFAVQYHPEASAGPHDSHYLFAEFRALIHPGPPATAPAV